MALIGTIRKRGWILIVLMTLALGGFMMMDMDACSQRYSAADVNSLGKVGEKEIARSEFETYEKLVYSEQKGAEVYQIRNQSWTYFVERAIVQQAAEPLGLGVGKEELLDLQFGLNLSPIVAERFKNEVGQPDRSKLANIKNAIEQGQFTEPRARAYWAVQEKEVVKARLQEKLIDLVGKGMFTPKWQAEMVFKENNERRDFCAVLIQYSKIKDEEAPVEDSDYKAFLKENPHAYDQVEEIRIATYASFDVVPTAADTANARESVIKLIEGLRTTKNDSAYVIANGGSFLNLFVPKDKFPASYADSVMNAPIGSIVGPLMDQGEWNIIKVLGRKVLPDSVRARHILIREPTPESESRIDSLMAVLKAGKQRFDTLAMQVSQDPGSGSLGGDLGWFANGQMVAEFNNVCFITGEQGKLYKVATQFGWHIIEITGKKFVTNEASAKVAVLGRRVEPSKSTQQAVKDKAVALIQKAKTTAELEALASSQNIKLQNTKELKINEFNLGTLGATEDARSIVRWAFDEKTKNGSVSPEVFAFGDTKGGYFDSKYVVAAISKVIPKGGATVETLKILASSSNRVKNLKKGAYIKSKTEKPGDMAAFAAQWGGKIDTLRGANFLQSSSEPRVTGTLFSTETGKVSDIVLANGGAIMLMPLTDKSQFQLPADLTMFRRQMASQFAGNMRMNLIKSLEKKYKVQDNRFRFW
ncbi:MAG: peptidylprolyl isomerase [Saprospiraceae bacterium]